jgi:hypothetical protein
MRSCIKNGKAYFTSRYFKLIEAKNRPQPDAVRKEMNNSNGKSTRPIKVGIIL